MTKEEVRALLNSPEVYDITTRTNDVATALDIVIESRKSGLSPHILEEIWQNAVTQTQ